MNERDELAGIIYSEEPWTNGAAYNAKPFEWSDLDDEDKANFRPLADAILAAGYRKPRTITTVEELDALPIYSVVLAEGVAYQHYGQWEAGGDQIQWSAEGRWWVTSQVDLPATVLHEPVPLP